MEALPGATIEANADGYPTGLTGTLRVRIVDTPAGTIIVAPTTAGIVEAPAGSGLYGTTLTAPAAPGTYSIVWDDQAGLFAREELIVEAAGSSAIFQAAADYTTPDAVRAAAKAPTMSDADALELIEDASDRIDRILVGGGIYPNTGRRLAPLELAEWQAAKLSRATALLAAAAHTDPAAFTPSSSDSVKGPAFEVTGIRAGVNGTGEVALRSAAALLDQAQLRTLTARARA